MRAPSTCANTYAGTKSRLCGKIGLPPSSGRRNALGTTLEKLLLELGSRLSGNREPEAAAGTITADGTLTAFEDTQRRWEADAHWNTSSVIFTSQVSGTTSNVWPSATGLDNVYRISSFTQSGGFVSVRSFAASVQSGDTYQLHRLFSPERKRAAVNAEISSNYPQLMYESVDESLTVLANTWRYAVPSRIHEVFAVRVETQRGIETYPFHRLSRESWYVEHDQSSGERLRFLRFDTPLHHLAAVGNRIRIEGAGPNTELSALSDTVPLAGAQLDPLYWGAIRRLWLEHGQSAFSMSEEAQRALAYAEQQYERTQQKVGLRKPSLRRVVERIRWS